MHNMCTEFDEFQKNLHQIQFSAIDDVHYHLHLHLSLGNFQSF